jgi:stearoyl-CoA desaturase (delta-9 desaturase)
MESVNPIKGELAADFLAWIVVVHLIALLAPFTFTWAGLIAFLVMTFMTLGLGITLCYHRLLAHRSFKTPGPIRYFLTFLGCLAIQKGPIQWVATHRLHHKETDTLIDPHSPIQGFWWSHVTWIFYKHPNLQTQEDWERYAPDLCREPAMRFLDRYAFYFCAALPVLLLLVGAALGSWKLGLSLVVWGWALRTVYTWHATWFVNSATHLWGYRSHPSSDNSRNNWWVALMTYGEGWHNNHHAYPSSAKMGFRWYEIDMTYWMILFLKYTGLATQITQPKFKETRPQKLGMPIPQ